AYVVSGGVLIAFGWYCWKGLSQPADTDRFRITAALVLAINIFLSPFWHEYDLILLLPAILIVFSSWDELPRLHPLGRAVLIVSAFVLVWQWIGAAVVLAATFASPALRDAVLTIPWWSITLLPTFLL